MLAKVDNSIPKERATKAKSKLIRITFQMEPTSTISNTCDRIEYDDHRLNNGEYTITNQIGNYDFSSPNWCCH